MPGLRADACKNLCDVEKKRAETVSAWTDSLLLLLPLLLLLLLLIHPFASSFILGCVEDDSFGETSSSPADFLDASEI